MKLKGINPLEQHVEKIVLGGVSIVLVGVLALQFVTSPTIKVGTRELPPKNAFDPAKQAAAALETQLASEAFEPPEGATGESIAQAIKRRISTSGRAESMASLGQAPKFGAVDVGAATGLRFAAVAAPAPGSVVASGYRATVDPRVPREVEGLAALLPAQQPFDMGVISVETSFDGTALRSLMERDPDGESGPLSPLPRSWWEGGFEVLAVEMERQLLGADGSWGPSEAVAPMPGQVRPLSELRAGLSDGEAVTLTNVRQAVSVAAGSRAEVLSPRFYATIAGPKWAPPSELVMTGTDPGADEVSRLKRQLASIDRDIEQKQKALENVGQDPGRQGERPGREGGGGGGPRPGERGPRQPTEQQPNRDEARRQAIQNQIDRLQKQRDDLVVQLRGLGETVDGEGAAEGGLRPVELDAGPILDRDSIAVWSHDLRAEAGATYRYRVRLVMNNPLFGRATALADDQQKLAEAPTVEGAWSAWGDPVSLDPEQFYFISSANAGDLLGGPRASAEVFKFYYGYYRRGTTPLEPGDPIRSEIRIANGDKLEIYDLDAAPTANQPDRPGEGPGQPGYIEPPGGRPGEGGGPRGNPQQPTRPSGVERLAVLPGGQPGPTVISAAVEATLLDVALVPAGQRAGSETFEAFLRDRGGRIIARRPDRETGTELYARVRASAAAGEAQVAPEPEPESTRAPAGEPGRTRPVDDHGPSSNPRDPGGGGGGGG
ncbi:MAG: hypothetical protein RBS39_06795 [Phycisphaerales bacterium]|jgi:hypothetical protein|nr:hypothetical protein [Phycisphaerales bacterium]